MNITRTTAGTFAALASLLTFTATASAQESQLGQGQFAISAERILEVETARDRIGASGTNEGVTTEFERTTTFGASPKLALDYAAWRGLTVGTFASYELVSVAMIHETSNASDSYEERYEYTAHQFSAGARLGYALAFENITFWPRAGIQYENIVFRSKIPSETSSTSTPRAVGSAELATLVRLMPRVALGAAPYVEWGGHLVATRWGGWAGLTLITR